jgi:hypothetical protein
MASIILFGTVPTPALGPTVNEQKLTDVVAYSKILPWR